MDRSADEPLDRRPFSGRLREPRGAHQWTVLIGRNIKTGDHKTLGYFHLDSEKGQDIMRRCKARLQGDDPQGEFDL